MKISLITVTYNAEEFIHECVQSVLNQTYLDVEHIIIDGNSTDGTISIVNKYKSNRTRIISEPDKGIYDAMNKGIAMATGDVIGILNADDFFPIPMCSQRSRQLLRKSNPRWFTETCGTSTANFPIK